MFDDEITILYFFVDESKERIKRLFPNMDQQNLEKLVDYYKTGISPVVIRNGEVINPKSDDNIKKQKEEFRKRFNFIMDNGFELLYTYSCPIQNHLGYIYLQWLEELVLGNKPLEDTYLFNHVKEYKRDPEFMISEIERYESRGEYCIKSRAVVKGDKYYYAWILLSHLVYFIRSRKYSNSYDNIKELEALDEYFRVLRYSNDGIEWKSGFDLYGEDLMHSLFLIDAEDEEEVSYYDSSEFEGNEFICCFATDKNGLNDVHFSEKEKQEIYLQYHDELPWDYVVDCREDDTLKRPDKTNPCGNSFVLEEKDIFGAGNGKYYCMCPECGYIINIPREDVFNVLDRVSKRCNYSFFKKMMIYSELLALDKESGENKVLIKKEEKSGTYGHSYIMDRLKKGEL